MILEQLRPTFQSVGHVLSNYVKVVGTKPGAVLVKHTEEPLGDVTGMCSVYGNGFHLSFALSFNIDCILSIAANFTQQAHDHCDNTVLDVVSIITTMVGTDVKRRLKPLGYEAVVKHPVVYYGYDNKIVHPMDEPRLILPTNTEWGIIFLEVCVEKQMDYRQAS